MHVSSNMNEALFKNENKNKLKKDLCTKIHLTDGIFYYKYQQYDMVAQSKNIKNRIEIF